jgi:hypothetical protein
LLLIACFIRSLTRLLQVSRNVILCALDVIEYPVKLYPDAFVRWTRIRFLMHWAPLLMISNGEDIVRVSRLMGHANASITLNVYSHLMPREHDPSGARLAALVFGNNMKQGQRRPRRPP